MWSRAISVGAIGDSVVILLQLLSHVVEGYFPAISVGATGNRVVIIRLFSHCSHMTRRLLLSHFNVGDRRLCDHYSYSTGGHVIRRLLLSHLSVCDRRPGDHSHLVTQPFDQEATFSIFQCKRHEVELSLSSFSIIAVMLSGAIFQPFQCL